MSFQNADYCTNDVEQLPTEPVYGFLYHLLQQIIDCYHSLSMFDNHIEFIDEMVKNCNF